jgi:predicted RNA-binding Zn ribbon-like protein
MAVEAAMAFIDDLVRSGGLRRLRICEYPGCGNVVVDLSKNRPSGSATPAAATGPRSAPTVPQGRRQVLN